MKEALSRVFELEIDEQKETEDAMVQSSAGLLLRIWEEVFC